MARTILTGVEIAVDSVAQTSETTIGAVGRHAVILTTTLPTLAITLTSSYLAAMVGDVAASHLSSVPGGPPIIDQHVLPASQPGETHAQICLLDHVAEVHDLLDAFIDAFSTPTGTVTITIADDTRKLAERACSAQDEPPT